MSLVSSRLSLLHRCTVERDENAGTDDTWGNPLPPNWFPHLEDLPCRSWISGHRPVSHQGSLTSVLITVNMLVPLGSDVTDGDRVESITVRGEALHEGPLAIHAVLPRQDHLELILSRAA